MAAVLALLIVVGLALFGVIRAAVERGEFQWLTYLLMIALVIAFFINRERYKEKKQRRRRM